MAAATTTTMKTSRRRLSALADAAVLVLAVCSCFPAAAAAPAPAPPGKQYRVGGDGGWLVPPPENKDRYYADWASNTTFYVGDSLEFVYRNDSVLRVSKAGYYHCNETVGNDAATAPQHDGRTVFLLDAPGDAYFASADLQRCGMGERLAVTVLLAATTAAAPAPTSSWSSSAPGPWSWVLSPSATAAASPSAAAAVPVVGSSCSLVAVVVAVAAAAGGLI